MVWDCFCLVSPTMAASSLHRLTATTSKKRPSSFRASISAGPRLGDISGSIIAPISDRSCPRRRLTVRARLDDSEVDEQQRQLNFSVLRFTLGIPGLDESYLPRYIGWAFGSLIFLNHFFGSSDFPTSAQLRSEALGICLAGFSVALPYFGKFLKVYCTPTFAASGMPLFWPGKDWIKIYDFPKLFFQGASPVDRSILPEGNTQIFVMSADLTDSDKEDLAWGSYVLLRNTNSMSVLMSIGDALCIRGYWKLDQDALKADMLDLFFRQIQQMGLTGLTETLYFPQGVDPQFLRVLPEGALSVLLQPICSGVLPVGAGDAKGFILLASSSSYAYRDSDRAWISVVANKFQDVHEQSRPGVNFDALS